MPSPCFNTNNHIINVNNLRNGDELPFSLMLLKGNVITKNRSICSHDCTNLNISSLESETSSPQTTFWPISNSEFKCLLNLIRGNNRFVLEFCSAKLYFNVRFGPKPTLLSITPVYIICKGHDGRFQSPECEDNSTQSACERINIGLRLIQTLIAEKLFESGYGRKSFQLSTDLNCDAPECCVFYSKLPVEEAYGMTQLDLWEYFAREIMTSTLANKLTKYAAFISCTKYIGCSSKTLPSSHKEILALTKAHAALGGGGLALFGTACLHTWPCTVEEVVPRFLCGTKVDKTLFMDDSFYRGTYGSCFSTTLGSVCHELGHTFDLGHTKDGIMGHDYNNFHCVFTLHEKASEHVPVKKQAQSPPKHATVPFSKNLFATFKVNHLDSSTSTVCSKGKLEAEETCTNRKISQSASEECLRHLKWQFGKLYCEDKTQWSESCAAILAYHRWFNSTPTDDLKSSPTYHKESKTVSSASGLRVIELRDSEGTVCESWLFTEGPGLQHFLLPSNAKLASGSYIVALDSAGALLKETIS